MYLMIQNKGEAPVEAFTLLGASTNRDYDGCIGQFGTGTKHSINLLLRERLPFRVYCGKTRLDFQTQPHVMDDGLTEKTVEKVVCQFGGTSRKKIDLGWVLEFGSIDWNDIGMALREFISNAIDRTVREFGQFESSVLTGDLCVKIVDKPMAKTGYTRVFIKVDDEGKILQYLSELPKRFLHFSSDPSLVKEGLLPKGRNLEGNTAMIYREGVFVRQMRGNDSIYDYNFKANEIDIDDCRNASEYSVRSAIAKRLRNSTPNELATVFEGILQGPTLEGTLDAHELTGYGYDVNDEHRQNWSQAWINTIGENSVAASADSNPHAKEYAKRKGFNVVELPDNWANVANSFGIKKTSDVLNANEREGKEILPPTDAANKALDMVWEWIDMTGQTNGKSKPTIACYRELTDAESDVMGFFRPGERTVYVREDIASGLNKYLLKTTLEEAAHYVTGATDNSRDFQSFFMDMIVELVA